MIESKVVAGWRAEERVETMRDNLLRALEVRFKQLPPPELVAAVETNTNLDDLSRWFDSALTANSLEEFRTAVQR